MQFNDWDKIVYEIFLDFSEIFLSFSTDKEVCAEKIVGWACFEVWILTGLSHSNDHGEIS